MYGGHIDIKARLIIKKQREFLDNGKDIEKDFDLQSAVSGYMLKLTENLRLDSPEKDTLREDLRKFYD